MPHGYSNYSHPTSYGSGAQPGPAWSPAPRQTAQPPQRRSRGGFGTGLRIALGYVLVIWAVFVVQQMGILNLSWFGIHPRDTSTLWHVATWSFLHANLDHLIGNTVTGALFAFLVGVTGRRTFWEVTVIAAITGGLAAWFLGYPGTNHIGASGVIYGWLSYLIVRGVFNRSLRQIILGVVLAFSYSGFVWGVIPTEAAVSWQAHLGGALGGVLAGAVISSDDPVKKIAARPNSSLGY
ncbi:rhomboid family intramembrane serine protease [Corynebacterium sp. TAE3-ERU30]|uniref:rhomboid family intramembrane serine protease n=1 Tax=Corynebacterium sp. TAE3-ERU30 TaxID=2849496 RepID=UPI001C46686C|nr:rhomboid family intramembrane serine protease [Corynebacterium sp. TAE3-ERU30]MBV7281893.1 rhomboid family intramembrane serine protease [Corynebacterium sp. TAE3-ERU30]